MVAPPTAEFCLTTSVSHRRTDAVQWWHTAVVYQVYPRSFADSDGDGYGDLPGITAKLGHLTRLGVDALWLSPFYTSPQVDAGYDVADYRSIDPLFGTLADADALIERAHQLGLKVVIDLVPNHTSSQHVWFQAALAAGPGSAERARYIFRDGRGEDGEAPPNNWRSVFGGPAWTRTVAADGTPGQWYLHLFDPAQPDLDWTNPEVAEEFRSVLRFWLDRGVDGFRVDVAHGMAKAAGLPDWDEQLAMVAAPESGAVEHVARSLEIDDDGDASPDGPVTTSNPSPAGDARSEGGGERESWATTSDAPMWDQPGVHDIYRDWNSVLAEYGPDRMLVCEAWVEPLSALAAYVRPDEAHQTFNFAYLASHWDIAELREVIEDSIRANDAVGAPTTWVLSNHDVVRHATRLGMPSAGGNISPIGPEDAQPDAELGLRRARAATLLSLALPGSAYLYQGEELGLPEHTTLAMEVRQDPAIARGGTIGRDGCRVPIPWRSAEPAFGFSPNGAAWLPQPAEWEDFAVDAQKGIPGSTYEMYRDALRLRRCFELGLGGMAWIETPLPTVLALANGRVMVFVNLGSEAIALPRYLEVVLASGAVQTQDEEILVPPDTAVWTVRADPKRRNPFGPD